ncbi:MAG: hypothetical protein P1Q69_11650, partial [Candidatus Thorarchaeota archaeon]|nr:hypothetical protein [Candidatus Thorarchaeota archaeon]
RTTSWTRCPGLYRFRETVPEKYRGSKKGKWLKAAMLLKIKQDYPDVQTISTVTATSNAPMLSINERLGFKVHREIYTVQFETEQITKYLEGR